MPRNDELNFRARRHAALLVLATVFGLHFASDANAQSLISVPAPLGATFEQGKESAFGCTAPTTAGTAVYASPDRVLDLILGKYEVPLLALDRTRVAFIAGNQDRLRRYPGATEIARALLLDSDADRALLQPDQSTSPFYAYDVVFDDMRRDFAVLVRGLTAGAQLEGGDVPDLEFRRMRDRLRIVPTNIPNNDLASFVSYGGRQPDPGAPIPDLPVQRRIVSAFFGAPGADEPQLRIQCLHPADSEDGANDRGTFTVAVRGSPDALATYWEDTSAFEKSTQASISYTEDQDAGTSSAETDFFFGVGRTWRETSTYIYGFAGVHASTKETELPGDDDDTNDSVAISAGIILSNLVNFDPQGTGTRARINFLAYPTFDLEQESEMLRMRLAAADIAFPVGGYPLCGGYRELPLPLLGDFFDWDCSLEGFVELGHVFDPGTNPDLATLEDDEYFGLGGEAGLFLRGRQSNHWLAPITFSARHRRMTDLTGELGDPWRWHLTLGYRLNIPTRALNERRHPFQPSLEISYIDGQDFTTFQDEELVKLGITVRY